MYGPRLQAEARSSKAEDKVFLDTDRPRPLNNTFIFPLEICLKVRYGLLLTQSARDSFYCGISEWRVELKKKNNIQTPITNLTWK